MSTNLSMTRGDDKTLDIDVVDPNNNDAPVELSGFGEIWFTAKHRISDDDTEAVVRKVLNDGLQLDGMVTGRAAVTIDAGDTDDLPDRATRLVWDVQVLDAESKIKTIASGTLVVSPDVTRANAISS